MNTVETKIFKIVKEEVEKLLTESLRAHQQWCRKNPIRCRQPDVVTASRMATAAARIRLGKGLKLYGPVITADSVHQGLERLETTGREYTMVQFTIEGPKKREHTFKEPQKQKQRNRPRFNINLDDDEGDW